MPPGATYRIQLTPEFGFRHLRQVAPYLRRLGVSHLYLSPVFRARAGSSHGYDVTDHGELNPELGGERGFMELARACRALGMGLVLDIVPNHMAVMTNENAWWTDVLRHGRSSRFAHYFDIDWRPSRATMRDRLLVPVLGDPLGDVIDGEGLRLVFDAVSGDFGVCHGGLRFPLDPATYPLLLDAMAARGLPPLTATAREGWLALRDAFAALPPTREAATDSRVARDADSRGLSRTFANLCAAHDALGTHVQRTLDALSHTTREAHAQLLADLLEAQPYRLAFWRVSGEEINYRRFFDVNELAALRVEEPDVFDATHSMIGRLWRAGAIQGLRVDHADGLYDAARYFQRLRTLLQRADPRPAWIVAEKILGAGEKLPAGWEVQGTTGYEFGALVAGWMMHPGGAETLRRTWQRFAVSAPAYAEAAWQCRRLVMRTSLAAEISGLAARLDRLAQMHRNTLDFTLFDLRQAIVEVIATFPVYRTYASDGVPGEEDSQRIRRAVGAARAHRIAAPRALDFLERVLLGQLADDPLRGGVAREFVMKFQQVTAPVMARGIEDTAFYRHACFLAMNEVGGDPQCRGVSTDQLHRANEERRRDAPQGLLATSTHDTKRGEDPRARLCVLAELAPDWSACAMRWRRLKSRRRSAAPVGGAQEYLLLQSLLSIWPLDEDRADWRGLRTRLEEYAVKAAREAKESTSWLEPDAEYERVLRAYVDVLLPGRPERGFRRYFEPVLERVLFFGLLNSLAAAVLKFTVPGVPDLYQGNELPALVLVDPDNRRTPDYAANEQRLQRLQALHEAAGAAGCVRALVETWRSGDLKLYLTWRLLALRRRHAGLFESGDYTPLEVKGARAAHLCAYVRHVPGCTLLVVVSRWAATLAGSDPRWPVGKPTWEDARVLLPATLPAGRYRDALTGQGLQLADSTADDRSIEVAVLLETLPFCVLLHEEDSSEALEEQQ